MSIKAFSQNLGTIISKSRVFAKARVMTGALAGGGRCALSIIRNSLRLDWRIGCLCALFLLVLLPTVTRHVENPQMMAAYSNDEPFLAMALDATTRFPWGNPANYFDIRKKASQSIPEYWGSLRYPGITYYGGAMFMLTFPPYASMRAVGFPAFPTAPMLLRLMVVLAGLASLVVLYNVGKERGFAWAGLLAAGYLGTNNFFIYYATNIHPDTLQLLFGLLAFVAAVLHVRDGERASLMAFGLFCGFVQASKVGAPWLAPAALIVLTLGSYKRGWRGWMNNASVLIGAGLCGWFIAGPYTFLDSYYLRSLFVIWSAVYATPFGEATLLVWFNAVRSNVGNVACAVAGLAVIYALWTARDPRRDPAPLLAVVIALSQLLWFGSASKVWTVVGYLLVGIGLVALFALEAIAILARRLLPATLIPGWVRTITVVLLGAWILIPRGIEQTNTALELHRWRHSTVMALNRWASEGHIPPKSAVVFDDLAYFDPKLFAKTRMHGGVLTWHVIPHYTPDYLVLSGSLYDAAWYQTLRSTQSLEREDPYPFNVRLYQDLLTRNDPGPVMAGIDLVKVMRAQQPAFSSGGAVSSALHSLVSLPPLQPLASGLLRFFYLSEMLWNPPAHPTIGPELRIFRFDWRRLPHAFGEGTVAGYSPGHAFDGTNSSWTCAEMGEAALKCRLGYDFGENAPIHVRELNVTWVYGAATPNSFRLEHSDDGEHWLEAAVLTVPPYSTTDAHFRVDTFQVPERGAHRYWRVMAVEVPPNRRFAIAELKFVGPR